MKPRLVMDGPERTWVVVFDEGDEPMSELGRLASELDIAAARITGVGGFSSSELGFFRIERHDYDPIAVAEQAEVLSFLGDISSYEGEVQVHAHVVVGLPDGSTRGGHLLEGSVRPTLEVLLDEYPTHLRRRFDRRFGIPLIDPGADGSSGNRS